MNCTQGAGYRNVHLTARDAAGPLDLNTARIELIAAVTASLGPGGESVLCAIKEARARRARFMGISDLFAVEGIDFATVLAMQPYLTVHSGVDARLLSLQK